MICERPMQVELSQNTKKFDQGGVAAVTEEHETTVGRVIFAYEVIDQLMPP